MFRVFGLRVLGALSGRGVSAFTAFRLRSLLDGSTSGALNVAGSRRG